jgi:DNA-directed RNA polymerase specialized sigma24 family protein
MEDPVSEAREARALISHCLAGDPEAVKRFQQEYGELIYGYPIRVYRTPPEDAGDFYVFAFQDGRLFRRLRTFEGRAPLRAYLLGFVLDDLVLEWKRGERTVETVSIEGLGEFPDSVPAANQGAANDGAYAVGPGALEDALATLSPAKAVVMKLLYVEDYELKAADVNYITEVSGRSVPDVLAAVARLRARVREREAGLKRLQDSVDAVQAWIRLYERRVERISDDLASLPPSAGAAVRLRAELAQIEQKTHRRQQQRSRLLAQAQRRKVTAPYKEIATILNTSVGNVCSQIARVRRELMARSEGRYSGIEKADEKGVRSDEHNC